jgi:hypothetical protein
VLRSGVERMARSQALVGRPHDTLKLEELGQEARSPIVDLGRIRRHYIAVSLVLRSEKPYQHSLFGCVLVSIIQSELAMTAFLLQVTSCCSKPHSGSLTLCENR